MDKPECCGAVCLPYQRFYPNSLEPHSVEQGFRCAKCGRIRVPYILSFDLKYMESLAALREQGVAYDQTLINAS